MYSIKYQVPGPGGDCSASKGRVNRYQAHRVPAATVTTTVAVAYTANIGVTRRPRWSHRSKATTKIHQATPSFPKPAGWGRVPTGPSSGAPCPYRDAGSNSHEFARIRIRPEFARICGPLRIRIRNFKFESSLIRLIESIGTYNLPSRLHFTCLHMGMPLPGTISHKRFPKSFRNLAIFVVCCCLHLPC